MSYIFALPLKNKRALSSAGSEHLPYKQRVVGSNPTVPTLKINHLHGFNQVSGVLFAHVLHTTAFYKPSKETNNQFIYPFYCTACLKLVILDTQRLNSVLFISINPFLSNC